MRNALFAFATLPLPALAADITLNSRATEAVIYNGFALITHEVQLTADAGRHQLIFPDLPPRLDLNSLRVSVEEATLGAIRYRSDLTPSRPVLDTQALKSARARVEAAKDKIQGIEDRAVRLELEEQAAEARITFLTGLGDSDALPQDIATLRDLAQMISEETLAARNAVLDARIKAREIRKSLDQAQKELAAAVADLDALIEEPEQRPYLVIDVATAVPLQDQSIRVTFLGNAYWQPAYDLRLADGDDPKLILSRSANVVQNTGENWRDIKLAVSTQDVSGQLGPSYLPPDRRRIFDPSEELQKSRVRVQSTAMADSAVMTAEAPLIVEEAAAASFEGLSLRYDFVSLVDVASGADALRIPFDTVEFDAEIFARAIPRHDDTAYLMARFTNSSDEPILPTDNALRYFDGALVGSEWLEQIDPGAETELAFGPIEGLQLTHRVLKRDEGDRGLIARSNELTQNTRITAKNLTNRTWQVELRDSVPFSEQEDLTISYSAAPKPDETKVDDQRGLLQWNIEMEPGQESAIDTSFKITWPDGMILR